MCARCKCTTGVTKLRGLAFAPEYLVARDGPGKLKCKSPTRKGGVWGFLPLRLVLVVVSVVAPVVASRTQQVSRHVIRDCATQRVPAGATASEVNAAKNARIRDF